jgi:hypothetical protein
MMTDICDKEYKVEYGVVDDYGDMPLTGSIIYRAETLEACLEWAENQNFHSASIVLLTEDGSRIQVR